MAGLKFMTPSRLVTLIEEAEYEPASYSGRFMYGERCVSVTVEPRQLLALGAQLAAAAVAHCSLTDVAELMRTAKWDNMGLDYVVYWPEMAWCEHEWQEQPGEPARDVCSSCGAARE